MTTEGMQAASQFLVNVLFLNLRRGHAVFKRHTCIVHTSWYVLFNDKNIILKNLNLFILIGDELLTIL